MPVNTDHAAPHALTPEFRAYLRSPLVIAHWGGSGWAGGGARASSYPTGQSGIRRAASRHQDGQDVPSRSNRE